MREEGCAAAWKGAAAVLLASLAAQLTAGCASPGQPRPPSLRLPRTVRDLQAVRQGNDVLLHWTAPTDSSDGQPLQHHHRPEPMTATLCRVQGPHCIEFFSAPAAPGQAMQAMDHLPAPLTLGGVRPLAYRVRVKNGAGRDAGTSRDTVTAAGSAPAAITALAASTTARGIQLTWQPAPGNSAIRVEAVTDALPAAAAPDAHQTAARLLQTNGPGSGGRPDPGGAVDAAAAPGVRTRYRVYRQQQAVLEGKTLILRGEPAEITAVRAADTFAPAAPTGLLAESFRPDGAPASVSLSWEPSAEADVAGYYVYRAQGEGDFRRITLKPVQGVSFNDTPATGLAAGQHYRYAVSAVDRAGNESARSAATGVDSR